MDALIDGNPADGLIVALRSLCCAQFCHLHLWLLCWRRCCWRHGYGFVFVFAMVLLFWYGLHWLLTMDGRLHFSSLLDFGFEIEKWKSVFYVYVNHVQCSMLYSMYGTVRYVYEINSIAAPLSYHGLLKYILKNTFPSYCYSTRTRTRIGEEDAARASLLFLLYSCGCKCNGITMACICWLDLLLPTVLLFMKRPTA